MRTQPVDCTWINRRSNEPVREQALQLLACLDALTGEGLMNVIGSSGHWVIGTKQTVALRSFSDGATFSPDP